MALTEEQLKSDLEGYLRKLAGVMPVGHYWFGIDPKSKPAGVQLYSGQLLFRSAYQKHWEFVSSGHRTVLSEKEWQAQVSANGFCPFYSSGDGSTTYRMPMVKGVHPKFVAALAEAGQYVDAGLPNITGVTGLGVGGNGRQLFSGAFSSSGQQTVYAPYSDSAYQYVVDFSANRVSSIYRDGIDTVQPPALTFLIGEYVVGSVAVVAEADAESLLASMTQLESNVGAMQSGSSFNAAGKAEIVGWGMPDYNARITMLGDTTKNVCPQRGFIHCELDISSSSKLYGKKLFFQPAGSSLVIEMGRCSSSPGYYTDKQSLFFPVDVGDTVWSEVAGSNIYFYPMKGA